MTDTNNAESSSSSSSNSTSSSTSRVLLSIRPSNVENQSISVDEKEWQAFQRWKSAQDKDEDIESEPISHAKKSRFERNGEIVDDDLIKCPQEFKSYKPFLTETTLKIWKAFLCADRPKYWEYNYEMQILDSMTSLPGFEPQKLNNSQFLVDSSSFQHQNSIPRPLNSISDELKSFKEQSFWGKLGYLSCAASADFAESAERTKQLIINADLKSEGSVEELLKKIKDSNKKIVDRNHFWNMTTICVSRFYDKLRMRRGMQARCIPNWSDSKESSLLDIPPGSDCIFDENEYDMWYKANCCISGFRN